MNSVVRLEIGLTWPGLEGIPQGCHVWHNQTAYPCILSYFVWDGESSSLPLWRHQPYLACIMFAPSPQVSPREFVIPLNQNKLPMKPDESVNPLFPPPYSHSILFHSVLRIWRESLCVFHIFSPFFFFQSGAFLPAPTLFALFSILLLSGCHALFWVMSRVVSEVRRSLRMMCWQQKSWIIWNHLGRLVGKGLHFKNKVARKVAYKHLRKHFRSCIIVQLH